MASGTRELNVELKAGNGNHWHWIIADGVAVNPLAGHVVDEVRVAQENSAAAKTYRLGVNYDSTP